VRRDEITAENREVEVDVRGEPDRRFRDPSRPALVRATEIVFRIPFEGDAWMFKCIVAGPTRGIVQASIGNRVCALIYRVEQADGDLVKAAYEEDLGEITSQLERRRERTEAFNASLAQDARSQLEARRKKLLADRKLVQSLGVPVRRREGAQETYAVPTVRRKLQPRRRPKAAAGFAPEPALDLEEYEFILGVTMNMVTVMERSPRTFHELGEEAIRDHFLVQLNGQYEGQATGETFNHDGKTDILIRAEGRNVFIAECMIWDGPQSLQEKINQFLGYAAWRDTKTAILVFSRRKDFTNVLKQIPGVVREHASYKRHVDYEHESGFRFALGHRDDPARELLMTVLAFDVPSPE